jgi:hypothetical protein
MRQQLAQPRVRPSLGESAQHVAQIFPRLDAIELAASDQRILGSVRNPLKGRTGGDSGG